MNKKILIYYFPAALRYTSPLFFIGGIYLGYQLSWFWTIAVTLFCVLVLTTANVTEIDLERKICADYLLLLGLKLNKEVLTFNTLDRIVITKETFRQTVNTRAQSRIVKWTDYTATLLMDSRSKLPLVTRQDKHELLLSLKDVSTFLNVDVEDHTTGSPYFVDMERVE